jgi:hypothetical protein
MKQINRAEETSMKSVNLIWISYWKEYTAYLEDCRGQKFKLFNLE